MTDKQKALIDLAMTQVGVHEEGGDNSGPVVEMYQRVIGRAEKEPWCVSFIQWCVAEIDQRFGAKSVLYPTESSQMLWLKTVENARVQVPEPGSIVVWTRFNGENPMSTGHVGIVREILDSEWMLTVEGNTSDSTGINRDGDGVFLKKRRIKQDKGIMRTTGFLMPWFT